MSGVVVLISGRGSNLEAMCKNNLAQQIKCVISNKASAPGLEIAKNFGIPTYSIDHTNYSSREEFDKQMASIIDKYSPSYVILAGFMRILSPWFVNNYQNQLVNIHPSILPAFIGGNAIEQAFNTKVKVTGVTIHFVTNQLDCGPIIAQGITQVNRDIDAEGLANQIRKLEHVIYPFIIHKLISNNVKINADGYVVVQKDDLDINQLGQFNNNIFY